MNEKVQQGNDNSSTLVSELQSADPLSEKLRLGVVEVFAVRVTRLIPREVQARGPNLCGRNEICTVRSKTIPKWISTIDNHIDNVKYIESIFRIVLTLFKHLFSTSKRCV